MNKDLLIEHLREEIICLEEKIEELEIEIEELREYKNSYLENT